MPTFAPTPLTIRTQLPSTTAWVNLEASLRSQVIGDVSIDRTNPGGLAKASFTLTGEHRLVPGKPIAFWDGGCPIGGGEIETCEPDPTSQTTKITVRGPAVTMGDSLIYDKTYVRAGFEGVRDSRSVAGVSGLYQGGGTHDIEEGKVTTDFAWNSVVAANEFCGWFLDMGPNNAAKAFSVGWQTSNNTGQQYWYFWNDATNGDGSTRDEDASGMSNIALNVSPGPSQSGATFGTARRFFGVFIYCTAAYTLGGHVWMRYYNLLVATDASYITIAGASLLKVDTVAKDIVANAGIPNINTRTDLIAAGSIAIQELVSNGDNPRSLLDRANASDGLQWRFTPEGTPALEMRAVPADAQWVLRAGEYSVTGGLSSSIEDVYNRVQVFWTALDGGQNVTTATLTPDTTILGAQGRTRTATVKVNRTCNSAEAAGIAALFLRENSKPPLRASLQINCGYVRDAAGSRVALGLIQAGDKIRVIGMRDPATGNTTREGVVYGMNVNPRTQVATLSLDSDQTIFDRQLAYFESRAGS